jgi:hypothetical protein
MKYVYYIAFISIVVVIGWIFRPVEHMSSGTCKRPVYGPTGIDGKTYPEVYGPDRFVYADRRGGTGNNRGGVGTGSNSGVGGGSSNSSGGVGTGSNSGGGGSSNGSELNQAAMYEDDGEFNSNTATRNAAYMNVFTFKPYAKTNFPVSAPPEPYLSDFANFHK